MFQTSADSCACRSIVEILGKYISNSELLNLVTLQTFFEVIHARTYSHIIKQTFSDPSEMIEDLYNEANVLRRLEPIVKAFDEITNLPTNVSDKKKRQAIIKTITALFALEAISFMSSFAVTFAITETKVFQGIGQLVKLICKDEVLHGRMDYEILNILKQDPEWKMEMVFLTEELKEILDSVVKQEEIWTDYLFSEGRQVIGLSAQLLKEYVYFMSKPVHDALQIPFGFPVITKNPLPYMDKYIDSTLVMALPQEIQITSYKIGAVKDDTDGLDLNLDFS
jgi:ribonucleoside-diphosphate reductase beta chain